VASATAPTGTLGGNVERFLERYVRHTKGSRAGQAFLLEPWQQEFIREFYAVNRRGRRVYRLGILGIPRGNGKSPLAAGCGLYELVSRRDQPDVFCVAGSKDQAKVVLDFAKAFVESGDLRGKLKPRSRSILREATGGVMRVLSSEGSLQYGLSVSAAIADELHAFASEAQGEVWNAILTALHKRVDSFALGISQCGYNKRTLLGRMYDQSLALSDGEDRFNGCLRIRRDRENGILFYWYGIPEQLENEWDNEELWRIVNPASWLEMETLRKQLAAPGFDELDFKRLHLNMWTKARDAWLPANVWNGLAVDEDTFATLIPAGADVFVGVDIGYYHDSSAVVVAHRVQEGEQKGRVALLAQVWTTKEEDPGLFVPGGKMQLSLVREHIERLAERYRVRMIGFDPKYFMPMAEEFDRRGLQTVEYLPSSTPMNEAYKGFYRAAMEGTLVHGGDPILSAHVEATAADKTDAGWRIRKLRATNRIDATVAASIAHSLCELHGGRGGPPQIFWMD
jgi:phage terminase large subunit-like protein